MSATAGKVSVGSVTRTRNEVDAVPAGLAASVAVHVNAVFDAVDGAVPDNLRPDNDSHDGLPVNR
ncbi:MAG: hypothetical protein OXI18_11670 [bacterium]|nr:hypothetical protein [bacterium]